MKTKSIPMMKISTMRRDLHVVMSLLLADGKMAEVRNMADWTEDFHEDEVRRLMLLTSAAMRGLLDLLGKKDDSFSSRLCGEYWADFDGGRKTPLTFRQACNSIIHAKELFPYKVLQHESTRDVKRAYVDRITVHGIHKNRQTRAQLDIIRFAQTADALIGFIQEEGTWQPPKTLIGTTSS